MAKRTENFKKILRDVREIGKTVFEKHGTTQMHDFGKSDFDASGTPFTSGVKEIHWWAGKNKILAEDMIKAVRKYIKTSGIPNSVCKVKKSTYTFKDINRAVSFDIIIDENY